MNAQTGCGAVVNHTITTNTSSALWGGGPTTFTAQTFAISGTLTINTDVKFDHCNLKMASGASIVMSTTSGILTIDNWCHIFCCGTDG